MRCFFDCVYLGVGRHVKYRYFILMGNNKYHHYVPQFYLRHFSTDEGKKLIGLYNCQNEIFLTAAPLRKQAREKNLYGDDDSIEKELSELEYYSSLVLARLLLVLLPPPPDSIYFSLLKKYILYQSLRTLKSGKEVQDKIRSATKELFKIMSKTDPKYDGIVAQSTNPVLEGLAMADENLPLLEYLECKILINRSNIPFISSDNPVAQYNQLVELKKAQGGLGWAVKGFQVFFPLRPDVMLVLFDQFTYNYGSKRQTQLILTNDADVNQLNALQFISCNSQLFFGTHISEHYIKQLVAKYSTAKKNSREITLSKEKILPDGKKSVQFLSTSIDPKINLQLSFSTLTKPAKRFNFPGNYSCERHQSLNKYRRSHKTNFS